jgi:ectoine hydroxylase-related dioxygenase (phytanoyl-CoA dioxygenase family)
MSKSTHPALANLDTRLEDLENQGYTIFPAYLDRATTAAMRAHIDHLAGPITAPSKAADRHGLRHPIAGEIMARLARNSTTLALAEILIGSPDLRLREQVLIRTDPGPPPYEPIGWHIDAAFCRQEFAARPRQVYYQMLHYCNTVVPGGAAVLIVPGSHKRSLAAIDATGSGQHPIDNHTAGVPDVQDGEGIEICANDGDLILFNPLCYHASSPNRTQQPRYVYFTSFYHPSATRLVELVRRTEYRDHFPDSLRQGLGPELQYLLEY